MNLFIRAKLSDILPRTIHILEKIERDCDSFMTFAQNAPRVRVALRDDKDFYHTSHANIVYIDGNAVLHVINKATNFQLAKWLKDITV